MPTDLQRLDGGSSGAAELSGRTRKGNAEVRDILTECAWSAGKTGSYSASTLGLR